MKNNNETNQEDANGKREVHPSRRRRLGIVRLGLLALMMIPTLGTQRCPVHQVSVGEVLACQDLDMQIEPGTCVRFQNPCDVNGWSLPSNFQDGFELVPTEEQKVIFNAELVWLLNDFGPDLTVRSICVGPEAPLHGSFPISYRYVHVSTGGFRSRGEGTLNLTVAPPTPTPTPTPTPLTASFVFNVSCCPETLQLDASASMGNIVSYTWDLSWTAANPDRVTSSPTTSFTIREIDRGTIRLTVADANGNSATTTRSFP